MIYPIIKFGDPVLETKAAPVTEFDSALRELLDDMFESMYAAHGVGLAAPQIGISRPGFLLDEGFAFGDGDALGLSPLHHPTALLPQLLVATEEGADVDRVQVIIGAENQWDALRDFGIVLSTYGIPSEVTGLVAVLGPTRMYYERTISSVRYVSHVLSDLLAELYTTRDVRRELER